MSLIEEQFVLKTNGNEAYRVLVNFWSCIKIHVPNILSCVSQVFPHYTKHDASHSYAILDSIERILGKEAIEKKLSVTDLWLLLCSAFYHDIGMYISGKEIQDCFKSEKFQKYLCDLKDDTKLPLNKFANCFAIKDGKLNYDNCELSLDSYNAARYLLADFFRVNHADRSKDFLQADPSVAQMFSEINRLITTIAEICRLHGESFQEVMKCNDVENGVNGIEDYCHPRFAACMLRLGDLLDFDSSRVSRFSLDHLSSSIPSDSKIHNEKNYCIKHALITPEKVDVLAECKDVEVAFEIDKWFTLIREEMSNQRNRWHDIVADLDIKGFPMCGKLETKLLDYEKIDNNLKAKFEIEGDNAIKILQGSGLYDNNTQCIREILQNAIDATYLRIYLERKDEYASLPLEEGFEKFVEICKLPEYQIEVECEKEEVKGKCEEKGIEKNKKYVWHIVIKDHGIGMRKEDLNFLLKIGSGKNNKKKFDIINQMPEYAKPSGIFGIGFQSIFLITDKVNIKSRYALCDEVIDMEIGTPLKGGFALLKTKNNPFAEKGTTISFDVTANSICVKKIKDIDDYDSYYEYFERSYDFIENEEYDVEIANILDEINKVGKYSYLDIICRGKKVKEKKEMSEEKEIVLDNKNNLIVEISPLNGSILNDVVSEFHDYDNDIEVFYRNEKVAHHNISLGFISVAINILSGNSDEILSVSRNDLKIEYVLKIEDPLKKIINQWLIKKWGKFNSSERKMASVFIEYYGEDEQKSVLKEEWRKVKIHNISFGKKLKYDSIIMRRYQHEIEEKKQNNSRQLILPYYGTYKFEFLVYILRKYYKNYGLHLRSTYISRIKRRFWEMEFKKDSEDSIDWIYWLEKSRNIKCRLLMPCIGYEKLQVKVNAVFFNDYDPMQIFEKVYYPRTVCPYVVKDDKLEWDCSDKVIQWVCENNINDKVTEDDIRNEYGEMKTVFDVYVKKINDEVDKRKAKEKKDREKKDTKEKNVSQSKKQVEKKGKTKSTPKTSKTGKKQIKAKAKAKKS
ncbi:ATP-binding protein [Fibrobacter succinogenes]|uniref:HD domain-containing protein n=1 Tax=Fibrobacter succinogenes TaxID=833 RepID=UPI0015681CE8|nr:ATP-binding protein [Fibrobacter succinogenes]